LGFGTCLVASINGRLEIHLRREPDARGPLYPRNPVRRLEQLLNG
jgi:hypothetical protein